jgi:hypothetical protein
LLWSGFLSWILGICWSFQAHHHSPEAIMILRVRALSSIQTAWHLSWCIWTFLNNLCRQLASPLIYLCLWGCFSHVNYSSSFLICRLSIPSMSSGHIWIFRKGTTVK